MRRKKALLNITATLTLQFITFICGFIIPKFYITQYGSNVYGLISSITQFLAYISLLESGFGPVVKAALYKPIAKKDKKQVENILKVSEKFFRTIAFIFIVYLIVLSVVYPVIVNKEFSFIFTMSLVIILSFSTLSEYFFGITYKLYLQAEQRTYITTIIQIIGYVLNTTMVIVLIKLNCSIHVVKLVSAFIFILRPIAQNIYVKKRYNIDLSNTDKSYKLEKKWDGLVQHIAAVIHNNTDIAILTIFSTLVEVSVYSIYYLVVNSIKIIVQAFSSGIDASFGDMIAKGEKENLNRSFEIYEILYYTIISFVWICTLILIVPFIKVYTTGITDTNYIRPAFATILVLAEFTWTIRLPYSGITLAAGHFKQTRIGAWVECILNLVLSLILVYKFGIIGVAIGTLVAMIVRTSEFVYHTSKYILERSIWQSFNKIIVVVFETLLAVTIIYFVPSINIVSYGTWILEAIITAIVVAVVVIVTNSILYRKELKNILKLLKGIFTRKKV